MKKKIISYLIITIPLLVLFLLMWTKEYYGNTKIEEIIFVLLTPASGTSIEIVLDAALYSLLPVMLFTIVFLLINEISKKHKRISKIFNIFIIIGLLLSIYTIYYFDSSFKVKDYIKKNTTSNDFIENNYTKTTYDNIVFPKQKKNLILIYLESMESTFMDTSSGGLYNTNYIPKLTNIAKENLSFSDKENTLGGAHTSPGLSWTMAGLISTTAGIPIKTQFDNVNDHIFTYKNIITLSDIMHKNNYNNSFMLGSDATFSGIEDYLIAHHTTNIKDLDYFKENNLTNNLELVEWGIKDRDLFELAKTELDTLSKQDSPFFFSIMTIDSHAPKGTIYKDCKNKKLNQYINSITCADDTISNFIEYLQTQDYYKDTVIILTGDHLSMSKKINFEERNKTIYNAFINTNITPKQTNNRLFTNIDMFPTILASLGATITNDSLALGTNLFSNKETLMERLGYDSFYEKISYYSEFYDKEILN